MTAKDTETHTAHRRQAFLPVLVTLFALMLFGGSTMEILSVLLDAHLPSEVQQMLGGLHADPWVARWVVVSNTAHLGIGLGFVVGALGMRRGRASWAIWARRSAWSMLGLTLSGQVLLSLRLYPSLWSAPTGLGEGPGPTVMLVSMIGAALFFALSSASILVLTQRGSKPSASK